MIKQSILVLVAISLCLDANAFIPVHHAQSPVVLSKSIRRTPLFSEDQSVSMDETQPPPQQPTKNLLQRLDDAGMSLKPKALEAKEKVSVMRKPSKKLRYTLQSCTLFTLFILYRAYRGFFVILPAVFREVYATMEKTVETPFTDLEESNSAVVVVANDINPKTGKVRWRTVMTVSVLAGIVTISYALSGAIRVVKSFLRTIFKTSSPSMSFLAAANEMETNESKIMNIAKKNNRQKSVKINGDPVDGLAP